VVGTVAPHKTIVAAPPALAPFRSLLQIADPISWGSDGAQEDDRVPRWHGGIEWIPEQKNQFGIVSVGCHGNTDALEDDFDLDGLTYADPFVVYAEDHCSTFGWAAHDYTGRATRQLLATQSAAAAAELERGTLAQADSNDNRWLTQNPDNVGAPAAQSVVAALGDVEMGLAEHFGGRRCMVHTSPAILTALHAAYALELAGNKWLTAMGNIVVADAGYLGAAPDGNNSTKQWIYGTLPVEYALSPVELLPGTLEEARTFATDVATNLTRVYAQRLVLLRWDEGVVTAETDIPAYS
jgi:hypothetical protein